MKIVSVILAAAAISLAGGVASAAVVTFDFEDVPNNGGKTYSKDGYVFAPINLNSSAHCAEDGPNPKHCFLEVKQGDPTELFEGTTVDDEVTFRTGDEFDLLGFYINFQGEGNQLGNFMSVYDEVYPGLGGLYEEIALGVAYNGLGNFTVYLASDVYADGSSADKFTDALVKQTGYFILFNNDYFDNITSAFWDASETANGRVDCVVINHHDGRTNDANVDVGVFKNCAEAPPEVIPLPAAGWLMLAALGGLAIMRRRKVV